MNALTILKLLQQQNYEEIKRLCEFEICSAKSRNITAVKAREKLARKVARTVKGRSDIAGAITVDGTQQICDGCAVGIYNDIQEGLVMAEYRENPLDFRNVVHQLHDKIELDVQIDLQELRNKSKLAAVDGLKSKDQLVRVGDGYYRTEYILDYLPTLTGSLTFSQQGSSNYPYKSLLVEGDNGCVLILPVRPSDKSMSQSVCAY